MTTDAPGWFSDALATRPRDGRVAVRGAMISYLEWGEAGAPPVLLVHGGGAHAHWWCHIAPLIAGGRHVVAVDLSGHGESGHRDGYPRDVWVEELFAVLGDAGASGDAVLVGHSMGGMVCVLAAETDPAGSSRGGIAGVVVVETPFGRPDPESAEAQARRRALRTARAYPDADTAVARFRLIPPQPHVAPWVIEHVARHSITATERGWTWRFDPEIYRRHFPRGVEDALAAVSCRFAFVRGSRSRAVTAATHATVVELLGRPVPDTVVEGAHHHVILDSPLAFVDALEGILAGWGV